MKVEFFKDAKRRVCGWVATPTHRRAFQGSTTATGRDLPHDLTQFTIERELGVRDGFWGLLAHGASFASVPGRKQTEDGRALVRKYNDALVAIELVVNRHYRAWQQGESTELRAALDDMHLRWKLLSEKEMLVLQWEVKPLPSLRRS